MSHLHDPPYNGKYACFVIRLYEASVEKPSEIGETGSTSSHKHVAEREFNNSPSLSAHRLPAPEIIFIHQRPQSPESFSSLDEFTALSPDSQIPHFDFQPYYCFHMSENGSVSSDFMILASDFGNPCLDRLFDEIRPESIVLEREFQESSSDISSNSQYTQSFLDYWLSELAPSTPQMIESMENFEDLSNPLPSGQSLPEEIVPADKFKDL